MSVIGTDCSIIGFGLEAKREETWTGRKWTATDRPFILLLRFYKYSFSWSATNQMISFQLKKGNCFFQFFFRNCSMLGVFRGYFGTSWTALNYHLNCPSFVPFISKLPTEIVEGVKSFSKNMELN
jgi:hypothetical protein